MIQIKQKQAEQSTDRTSTGIAINGDKTTTWIGGREKIQYASASLRTCLKSTAEKWPASGMRGF